MSEQLARQFHETYERLAPQFGYETRTDTKEFDPESKNGKLMIAVCGEVAGRLASENAKLLEIIKANLHQRKCHDCGHVFWAKEAFTPYCLCEVCGSQDTRRKSKEIGT